jgi:cytochrome oxidase Cu insertion factor (SCO1/SenC/PrrC family)
MRRRAIGGRSRARVAVVLAGILAGAALLRADDAGEPFPEVRLTDWDGGAVTLPIAGKASIVAYTYARCVYGCPLITQYLKELDVGLGRPGDIRYVHVSVNPAGDTPGEVRKHFGKFGIDPDSDPRWLFLVGPPESIDALLAERGIEVKRRRLPAGELIEHTIRVDVVDRRGRIAATFDTYLWDKELMHDAVRRSLAPR